jgi:hypothetical protein
MSIKARTIRMQNSLVMAQTEESKLTVVGNNHRLDYFGTRGKRASTFGNHKRIKMNYTDSGQMNKMDISTPNDIKSYVHLVGYIDPLGMF